MPTYIGNIALDEYNIRHTISGQCTGHITELTLSGGTSPYSVLWSGPNSYSANTFGIYNLCSGSYTATTTDLSGLTGTTTFTINAIDRRRISATISNDACITDLNGKCELKVDLITQTGITPYYLYELNDSENVVEVYSGTSGTTSHTFTNLDNGIYYVTVTNYDGKDGSIYYTSKSGITGTTIYKTRNTSPIPYIPPTTVGVTATTIDTRNIITGNYCDYYLGRSDGNPVIKPKIKASLQTIPDPTLTLVGTSKTTVKVDDSDGNTPNLEIYNSTNDKIITTKFIFGGNNDDIIIGNAYPKFKVLPYVFETEELATLPDYEGIFDIIPAEIDESTKSELVRGEAEIPVNLLSTDTSWEFIVRPSYISRDKLSSGDLWVDTDTYVNSSVVNNKKDRYMVVVSNPSVPALNLTNFTTLNNHTPTLKTEHVLVENAPNITATTYGMGTQLNYSSYTYTHTLEVRSGGKPLVTVNGVAMTQGLKHYGDYVYYESSRVVRFHEETIQNGDIIQFVYDANGGSYTQSLVIPDNIDTDTTGTIFTENDYYYINLERQSSGAVVLTLNGTALINDKDYKKTSDKQIMLMDKTLYNSGDTVSLFYRTIYDVISFTTTKEPTIPITYIKTNNLIEEVIVRLFDSNGDEKQKDVIRMDIDVVGGIDEQVKLKPPTFGSFSYSVLVKRYYPLMKGETITTESVSDRIPFTISRDVFYSPA